MQTYHTWRVGCRGRSSPPNFSVPTPILLSHAAPWNIDGRLLNGHWWFLVWLGKGTLSPEPDSLWDPKWSGNPKMAWWLVLQRDFRLLAVVVFICWMDFLFLKREDAFKNQIDQGTPGRKSSQLNNMKNFQTSLHSRVVTEYRRRLSARTQSKEDDFMEKCRASTRAKREFLIGTLGTPPNKEFIL